MVMDNIIVMKVRLNKGMATLLSYLYDTCISNLDETSTYNYLQVISYKVSLL